MVFKKMNRFVPTIILFGTLMLLSLIGIGTGALPGWFTLLLFINWIISMIMLVSWIGEPKTQWGEWLGVSTFAAGFTIIFTWIASFWIASGVGFTIGHIFFDWTIIILNFFVLVLMIFIFRAMGMRKIKMAKGRTNPVQIP